MSIQSIIDRINAVSGDDINYVPYNFKDMLVSVGTPPVPIRGLHYILSRHDRPQTKYVPSLAGPGPFVANQNMSGTIELGIMSGTVSGAAIQVIDTLGIPFPISIVDAKSGGTSAVVASACRRVGTPEWRRGAVLGIDTYTFRTARLLLSDGIRLIETA